MWQTFFDFLFPRHSLSGQEGEWITDEERRHLRRGVPLQVGTEELRAGDMTHLDRIVAAAAYHDVPLLRKAIHTFKYRGTRQLGNDLASLLDGAKGLLLLEGAVLCPVPLHWTRRFRRGFNQSELLARDLSARTGIPCAPLLRRTHRTGSQVGRGREERLTAVQSAFRAIGPVPASVILIDDLATTGATLDDCARALKEAGAVRVQGLVLARG